MAKIRKKHIRTRKEFLTEAKLKDVLLPHHVKVVADRWGAEFLEYEEVEPTSNIIQGEWKLSEEDKMRCISTFFKIKDLDEMYSMFTELPDDLIELLEMSLVREKVNIPGIHPQTFKEINFRKPNFEQIAAMYEKVFRDLSVSETLSDTILVKDSSGRPIKDENGAFVKEKKEPGSFVLSNNIVSIVSLVDNYLFVRKNQGNAMEFHISILSGDLASIKNRLSEGRAEKSPESKMGGYRTEFDIFKNDLYLNITHNPKNLLNMSMSKFFSSCMHLYHGDNMNQVLSNVFDVNSVPAFLLFKTPLYDKDNNLLSEHIPLSRMVIRNIENEEDDVKLFFDKCYPEVMSEVMGDMIEEYSGNEENISQHQIDAYVYAPDVPEKSLGKLEQPYMDILTSKTKPIIGRNTKVLYLNNIYDWSRVRIPKDNKLETVVVETTVLPTNFTRLGLELRTLQIKNLFVEDIKTLNVRPERIIFDKCILDDDVIPDCVDKLGVKVIHFESCDMDRVNFGEVKELDELGLIYTLESPSELKKYTNEFKFKKLVVSGELLDEDNRELVKELRQKNIRVEIVGPMVRKRK
jgi:hypothetical protein